VSIHTAIAHFRGEQRVLMLDTATVSRPGEGGTLDPNTGVWTPATTTTVYSGSCLLRAFKWEGTDVQYGDVEVRMRGMEAKFPVDTPIRLDDIIVPTSSTYDTSLIGISFRVTDVKRDGFQISRFCICQEITEGTT
jgi:hypothetical protein